MRQRSQESEPARLSPDKRQHDEAQNYQTHDALQEVREQRGHHAAGEHIRSHNDRNRPDADLQGQVCEPCQDLANRQQKHANKQDTNDCSKQSVECRDRPRVSHLEKLSEVVDTGPSIVGREEEIQRSREQETPPEPHPSQATGIGLTANNHGLISGNSRCKDEDKGDEGPPFSSRDEEIPQFFCLLRTDEDPQIQDQCKVGDEYQGVDSMQNCEHLRPPLEHVRYVNRSSQRCCCVETFGRALGMAVHLS